MIYPPNQIYPMRGMDSGIIAYNCKKAAMPHPALTMPMWDGAGSRVMDLGGRRNNGTLVNGPGWINGGLGFDGTNDHILVPHSSLIDFADEDLAVSLWFRSDVASGHNYIFTKNYGGDGIKWYGVNLNAVDGFNCISCYIDDGATNSMLDTTDNFNDGKWHHLVFIRDTVENQLIAYIDGVWNAEAVDGSGSIANTGDLVIGGRVDLAADRFYKGDLRLFTIFNCTLKTQQVKFLYENPYFMFQIPEELYGYKILSEYIPRIIMF